MGDASIRGARSAGRGLDIRLRLSIMMALQLAIWGAWAPKLFPYMGMLGFSPWNQALVGSCWGIASVVGVFFSNQFADRNFSAERFLAVSHLIGAVALVGAAFSHAFLPFFSFFLLYSLVYVPTLSVTNSIAFANLPNPARDFGMVRMGGTLGWILVSWPFVFLLSAHASASEVRSIFLVSAAVSAGLAIYSLTLPRTPPRADEKGLDKLAWRRALSLLRRPFVLALFVVTFIDSVVHNGYFVVSDAFLTNRVGIAGNISMAVLSLGQAAEVVTMIVLGTVLARLGWKTTMIIGILGHAARFSIFALFADSVPIIAAVQLVHGVCYAFFFATVYIFVDDVFPTDVRASAQGLFNLLVLGVGNVVASFLFPALVSHFTHLAPAVGGGLTPVVNYQSLFMVPTGMALAAVAVLALFFRPPSRRPGAAAPVTEGDMGPLGVPSTP